MFCSRLLPPRLTKSRICLSHAQERYIRIKRGTSSVDASLSRDERLLKKLEAQLATVQKKIKNEEEEAVNLLKRYKSREASQGSPESEGFSDHNAFFWEKVLTERDRRALAAHGVNSLDELATIHDSVQVELSQLPHPKIEDFDPKSRCAYEIYQSIPSRLHDAGRSKAGWFNGWF
ncbi:hypothetical protein AX15_002616 [Amanita polypyramis BW_CC]|nr:hypothetical protein AX15_002616 [Amanita polypyramis BW_CC]